MKNLAPLFLLLFFFACKKDEVTHPDIITGLVANMPLNGSAFDSISGTTGLGHHITPASDRHNMPNQSVLFSRIDSSYIDFGDLATLSFPGNQFTISCWINVVDTEKTLAILSKRGVTGPWEYSLDNHFNTAVLNLDNWLPDGSTSVYGTDPLQASAFFPVMAWEHIAYVADGTTLKVYVNGVLQGGTDQHNAGLSLADTDAPFVIGNGGGYGQNYYFNGCVDDLRVYNIALSTETIQYLAQL